MENESFIKVFVLLIFLIILSSANADVSLSLNKSMGKYEPGDTIVISATISNGGNTAVPARIEFVIKNKDLTYVFGPQVYSIIIKPRSVKTISLYNKKVGGDMPSGQYSVISRLIVNELVASRSEKEFFILGTLGEIGITLESCKDFSCTKKTKVFSEGETIYLNYKSYLKPEIDANLVLPNKVKRPVSLPYSFKAEQNGTYNLTAKASKEGYHPTKKSIQFAVIRKEPEIKEEKEIKFTTEAILKKQTMHIDYNSALKGIKVKAKITLPDGTSKEFTLPTTLELKQKGTYIIEATAEKTGWKKTTKITTIKAKEAAKKPGEKQPLNLTLIAGAIIAIIAITLFALLKLKR